MTDEAKEAESEEFTRENHHFGLLPPGADIADYSVQDPGMEDPVEDIAPPKSEPTTEQLCAWRREMKRIHDDAITKIKETEESGNFDDLPKYKWIRRMANKQIREVDNEVTDRLLDARQTTQPRGPLLEDVQDRLGSPMSLIEFDQRLKAILPQNSRPFLCAGSPFECTVFIVGINPRTPTPFEPYWDTSYGCRKSEWLEEYSRRHEGKWAPTRRYLEILHEALAQSKIKCLETNVFSVRSNRFKDLAPEDRTSEVFDFLLDTIRPKLLFVHGRPAIRHIEEVSDGIDVTHDQFLRQVRVAGVTTDIYLTRHLSYQRSKAQCRSLGEQLRQHMLTQQNR